MTVPCLTPSTPAAAMADKETRKIGKGPAFAMSADHRVKIQNSNILNALVEHVEGTREMFVHSSHGGCPVGMGQGYSLTAFAGDIRMNTRSFLQR